MSAAMRIQEIGDEREAPCRDGAGCGAAGPGSFEDARCSLRRSVIDSGEIKASQRCQTSGG